MVFVSAAFLITTIADNLKILGILLIATISELYHILRCFGTVSPFFLYEFWEYYRESLLLRELVDGKVYFKDCVLIQILTLFLP